MYIELINISCKKVKELREDEYEYLVLQNCGGRLDGFVAVFTEILKSEGIVSDSFSFNKVYSFKNNNYTNLLFPLFDKDIIIKKLDMFRLMTRESLGAMWLSDYVDKGYIKEIEKPKAPIVGADGNIFNLVGICSKALKNAGYNEEAKEMANKVTNSKSYEEALSILCDYIEPVDQNYNSVDFFDDDDIDINI